VFFLMRQLESILKEKYVTNQARGIARYFMSVHNDGLVFCDYTQIADAMDLNKRSIITYIKELKKKELIYVHRQAPYCNIYELIF
jgi:hypothetical protein